MENRIKEKLSGKDIEYLSSHGFLNMYKCKIALIREDYIEYLRQGVSVIQAITNLSIDFNTSESSIKRAVYIYKSVNF